MKSQKTDDVTKLMQRLLATHGESAPVCEICALVVSLVDGGAENKARIEALEWLVKCKSSTCNDCAIPADGRSQERNAHRLAWRGSAGPHRMTNYGRHIFSPRRRPDDRRRDQGAEWGIEMPDTTLIIPWVVNTALWCGYTFMLLATWCAALLSICCIAEWTLKRFGFVAEFLRFVGNRAMKKNAKEASK